MPYSLKSGPLSWTPATCTSSQQLLDPTRARTGPAKFGLRTPHRGPKSKKGPKISPVPVHGVSGSKKKCSGSGSHQFAVNNSREPPEPPFPVRFAAFLRPARLFPRTRPEEQTAGPDVLHRGSGGVAKRLELARERGITHVLKKRFNLIIYL